MVIPKKLKKSKIQKKSKNEKNTKKLKNKKCAIDENLANRHHGSKKKISAKKVKT